MVRLRAEEHRYFVSASGVAEASIRRIPGARFNATAQAYQLSRQPGVILALDQLFGADGWECPADAAQEVSEARSRQPQMAQQPAQVELHNGELAVVCAFADKELVKLVPGYRWSAPLRRWFVPAAPMALDLLRGHFGEHLEVAAEAEEAIEQRRRDEEHAVYRAGRVTPAAATKAPEDIGVSPDVLADDLEPGEVAHTLSEAPSTLEQRLDRLTTALEELVVLLKDSVVRPGPLVATMPEAEPARDSEVPGREDDASQPGWRAMIATLDGDAAGTLEAANRAAQTAPVELEPSYRVVAGLAQLRLHRLEDALGLLRRGLEQPGLVDGDLFREAAMAYEGAVLMLIAERCGALGEIESADAVRQALLDELVNNTGFRKEALASAEAQKLLDYLVNDPVLRRLSGDLSDYCRVAHLLGVTRAGQWMAANRVTDILREANFGDAGFALALVLLANVLYQGDSLAEWNKAWPKDDVSETFQDLAWLVAATLERLKDPGLESEATEAAALACLASIAGGPIGWATTAQRKSLVQLVLLRNAPRREYAEFLAGFQLAANGQRNTAGQFPGWTKVLAQTRLSRSASYLMDVAANDEGGARSLTWAVAESVYFEALTRWGIDDPQAEIMDLLDLLAGGPKPSASLAELGTLVEAGAFPGADRISRDLRKRLYQRALSTAIAEGHDKDALTAFDLLVRELRDEGAGNIEEIRSLCEQHATGMKALKGPALAMLLNIQLENSEPFQETADKFVRQFRPGDEPWLEFAGLALAYPEFKTYVDERVPDTGIEDVATEQLFAGKRVVVAGGHPSMRKHALGALERWGLDVRWFAPEELKGDRAKDTSGGAADLVVINTACIGHAGSERVGGAAASAGTRVQFNNGRGAGSIIMAVWAGLEAITPPSEAPEPPRTPKSPGHDRRRRLVP